MNTASICLKISAWLYLLIGSALSMATGSSYLLILFFAMALGVVAVAKTIDTRNRTAAWIGVVLLGLYTFSLFFFLGIPGLVAAYRSRNEWMAWGEQA